MKVSVVMSIYKEPIEWMKESIDSILNQTFSDFEFIIINDNPDRKENDKLLQEYKKKDKRIVIVSNSENIGLTKSLNKGLRIAKGKYIARMDADDISLPTRFEKQINYLDNNNDCIVCGTNIEYFGDVNKIVKYPHKNDDFFLFLGSPIAHPSVIFKNNILINGENITYNEIMIYAQDYDLWERLCRVGEFYNIQEVLLKYRTNSNQISKSKFNEQLKFAAQIRRNAFHYFCKQNKCNYLLPEELNFIELKVFERIVLKNCEWTKKEIKALRGFKYLMYRTVCHKNKFYSLLYFLYSLDFIKFPLVNSIKIFYSILRNKKNRFI